MKRDMYMEADDMFIDGIRQVFSVRTGEFVGYKGMQVDVETEIEPEPENSAQMKMEF